MSAGRAAMRRTTTSSSRAAHVRGCGPPSIHITMPMSARSSDSTTLYVIAGPAPILLSCRRNPDAGAALMAGLTRSHQLQLELAGALERVLHGALDGGQ